jgi:hypothetical protein
VSTNAVGMERFAEINKTGHCWEWVHDKGLRQCTAKEGDNKTI